jgi:hypothetical protein
MRWQVSPCAAIAKASLSTLSNCSRIAAQALSSGRTNRSGKRLPREDFADPSAKMPRLVSTTSRSPGFECHTPRHGFGF